MSEYREIYSFSVSSRAGGRLRSLLVPACRAGDASEVISARRAESHKEGTYHLWAASFYPILQEKIIYPRNKEYTYISGEYRAYE